MFDRAKKKMDIKIFLLLAVTVILALPLFAQYSTSTNGLDLQSGRGPALVAAIDFENKSDFTTNDPGRMLSAAVSSSLERVNDGNVFEVIDPLLVRNTMLDLGIVVSTAGGNNTALLMIADRLKVSSIVAGEIDYIRIVNGDSGVYAEIKAKAIVINRMTGPDPINGDIVTYQTPARKSYYGDGASLVNEAINTVGFMLARNIYNKRVPVSSVLLGTNKSSIQIRGGGNNGWKVGQRASVIRNGSQIGTLQVTRVTSTTTYCKPIDNRSGVAVGDLVIPLYTGLSDSDKTPNDKKNLIYGIAGATLASALLYQLFTDTQEQGRWRSKPVAYPLSNVAVSEILPQPSTYPPPSASAPYGGVYIEWDKMSNVASVICYVIYRSDPTWLGAQGSWESIPIAIVNGSTTFYIDATPAERYGNIATDPFGAYNGASALFSYMQSGLQEPPTNPNNIFGPTEIFDNGSGTGPGGGALGIVIMDPPWPFWPALEFPTNEHYPGVGTEFVQTIDNGSTTYSTPVLDRPVNFGTPVKYRVEAVYSVRDQEGGGGTESDVEGNYTYRLASTLSDYSDSVVWMKYPDYVPVVDFDSVSIVLSDAIQKTRYESYVKDVVLQIAPTVPTNKFSSGVITIHSEHMNVNTMGFMNIDEVVSSLAGPWGAYSFRVGISPKTGPSPKVSYKDTRFNERLGDMDGYVWSYPRPIDPEGYFGDGRSVNSKSGNESSRSGFDSTVGTLLRTNGGRANSLDSKTVYNPHDTSRTTVTNRIANKK